METIGDLFVERVDPHGKAKGPPILFVHGMWGGSWYWANYLSAAAEAGWEAWALNLRGHHGSRPVTDLGRVSVLDYVQDVLDCLRQLGEAVLVGHSMGGLVAQKVAETGGVRATVALTSAAPRGIIVLRWPALSRMAKYLGPMFGDRPFLISRSDANALALNQLSPDRQAWAYDQLVPESGRAAWELAFGLIGVNEVAVRCPLLAVGAEHDAITPVAVQRRIARKYSAEYLGVSGHAHMLMLEEGWELPFREVLRWVEAATR